MPVLNCIACPTRVRVPDGRGQLKVKCPNCDAEWFHPELTEVSELSVRCAKTGATAKVIFSRRSPRHNFAIQSIEQVARLSERSPRKVEAMANRSRFAELTGDVVARLSGPKPSQAPNAEATKAKNMLAHIAPGALASTRQEPSKGGLTRFFGGRRRGSDTAKTKPRTSSEYNWSGFVCPCCKAGAAGERGHVIHCNNHLSCTGTIDIREGGRWYACFCGTSGMLTEASDKPYNEDRYETFLGVRVVGAGDVKSPKTEPQAPQPRIPKTEQKALPPPKQQRQA